ncbi:MAG: cell surface protein [Lachnospiraceae bacterium]|nr:cell surface protein [Lachnospiraceae bacterium]
MRYSKKYIVMSAVLVLALALKFTNIGGKSEEVKHFRGARLEQEIWNPLIAGTVNEKDLSVLVDHRKLTNKKDGIYMDQNLNIMVPCSTLEESFNCGAHFYDKEKLVLEKRSDVITFQLNEKKVTVNGEQEDIQSPLTGKEGEYYVSLGTVADKLKFNYEWNIEKNQAIAVDKAEETSILPPQYDLRDRQRTSRVKNQGSYGTCWAFAALSAMESVLLPEEEQEFSPDHMSLRNSFQIQQAEGGEYTMGMAYLTAWQGPVLEKDDPYGDGESPENLTAVRHVQEIQLIEGKDFEQVKESVFKYGGVQTSIYSALSSPQVYSPYYNQETFSYCYIGTEKPNHEILIIGWDDNYPKENFNMDVEGNGAFLCQNSWGEEFGDNGVFYVSYYDVNIGSHNVVYTGVEKPDNYDHIYQSDLCGWVGQLGYNKDSVYGANVYQAQSGEVLQAAGFYATGKETSYELFVVKDFKNTDSLQERVSVAKGSLANAGYYTIKFDQEIQVEPEEEFAVVLHITTPGSVHPIAIEYQADEFTEDVDLKDGKGYISSRGYVWESTEEAQNCNLCLKVYSNTRK